MELKNRNYILVDVETTGFDEKKHQILEIGLLVIKNMKVAANLNIAIKHREYTITTGAMKANKIDIIEHEKEALTVEEAGNKMLEFLRVQNDTEEGFIAVGQNIDFDLRFLEAMFLNLKKIKDYRECVSYRKLDIMQLALIKNLENKISLEKQDLDTLLKALDIEIPTDRHRALTDCYLEFEVLTKLLNL